MDTYSADQDMPRRHGLIDMLKGFVVNALGATRNRVEDLSAEVQHRALQILFLGIWALAAAVSIWLALCFAMLTVIFGFGLAPIYAFGIPTLVFAAAGAFGFLMFRKTKRSKREESDYQDPRFAKHEEAGLGDPGLAE